MATLDGKILKVDNTSPMGGGSFVLRELSIMSPSSPAVVHLNSPGVFEELNIYEDLFSNVLRGTFTFVDNQGLAETLPIIGDETLILSFSTPGAGSKEEVEGEEDDLESGISSEEVFEQVFRIYDCIEDTTGEKAKFYKLFFVSQEYIMSTKSKISKGYNGTFYHQIVKDALKKINKTISPQWQKKFFIEKTSTPQNVIVPNWTPFQAINFCASRSLSSSEEDTEIEASEKNQNPFAPGSLFVFYEKLGTGFFYESIESMIIKQSTKKRIPLYQYTPKGAIGNSVGVEFFGVDKYEFKSSFKTIENLGFGMYGSKLIAYDPIRMKYDEVKYDYYEKENNPTKETLDKKTGATTVETDLTQAKDDSQRIFADFIATDISPHDHMQNKLISSSSDLLGSNEASIKLATTTKDHDSMFVPPPPPNPEDVNAGVAVIANTHIGVSSKTFKDRYAKPNKIENWLLQREMQLQEFGNIIITFNVAGNSARHVGDLIRFELPTAIAPDEMGSVDIGHQLYSGYYIVSKIRHIITPTEYKTDLELIKNSFAKRIPGQTTEVSTES